MSNIKAFEDGTTTRKYDVRGDRGEWLATVFLDARGIFSTVSDYGNYGYWWGDVGGNGDIRSFLLRSDRDPDYFQNKLDPSEHYDGEATVNAIRKLVIDLRRRKEIGKDEAREEYDNARLARHDFSEWYWTISTVEIPSDVYETRPNPQVVAFMREVMPRLCVLIRAEIVGSAKE
jgi:hypothetical protein